MKTKIRSVLIIVLLLCLIGYRSRKASCAVMTLQGAGLPEMTLSESELLKNMLSDSLELAAEEAPYFTFALFGEEPSIDIPLSDCICEYAGTDLQIYTKFIYFDREEPPYAGTVVHMQTPTDSRQIFSTNDYCVDKENGVVYIFFKGEEGFFGSAYKYFAQEEDSGNIFIAGTKIITTYWVEEWIADAYGLTLNDVQPSFSDIRLTVASLEHEQGEVILRGEASGIYSDTGERYYVEWEINDTTDEGNAVPSAFKVYDEEKDAEVFKACQEAFDLLEQGDYSVLLSSHLGRYWYGGHYEGDNEDVRYWRMDVNGDGLPELIYCSCGDDYSGEERKRFPIEYIYAYTGGMTKTVELVYLDLNDYTEYLFPGNGRNLIYNYYDHGEMHYGSYTRYQFDENWEQQPLDKIEIYYFYDADYYGERNDSYKEGYPDTYGSRGGGYYFFKSSPTVNKESGSSTANGWSREEITEEEFIEIYREMTGLEFFEENTDFGG